MRTCSQIEYIWKMIKYIILSCIVLFISACNTNKQVVIAEKIASKLNANEYSVTNNTYKNTSGINLKTSEYKFTFSKDASVEPSNVIPLAAQLIYSMEDRAMISTLDSVKVTVIKSDFSESRSYAPEQLASALVAIDLVKYAFNSNAEKGRIIASIDTPMTEQDVIALLDFTKSFRSLNEQENDLRLVSYEFKRSLADNSPAIIIRSDFSNKTEVVHVTFVISTATNKIRYVGINDEQP